MHQVSWHLHAWEWDRTPPYQGASGSGYRSIVNLVSPIPWMNERMNEWMNESNERTNERTNGWTNQLLPLCVVTCKFSFLSPVVCWSPDSPPSLPKSELTLLMVWHGLFAHAFRGLFKPHNQRSLMKLFNSLWVRYMKTFRPVLSLIFLHLEISLLVWWYHSQKNVAVVYSVQYTYPATTPDKTSWDKPKTRAYFFLTGNGNTIIVAEMLSLPSPLTQCCLEGLTVHQTCFSAAKQHWYGGEGENCGINNYHG